MSPRTLYTEEACTPYARGACTPYARGACTLYTLLLGGLLAACAAVKPTPRDAGEYVVHAQADLAAGKPAEAMAGFSAALERAPALLPAVRGRVEAARKLGRLDELAAEAQARTAATAEDGVAWYQLGLVRFGRGDQAGAVEALRRATQALPREADAWYRLGIALFDGERFAEARGPLERAVQLQPQSARYRVPLATCLDRLGDRPAALVVLREVPSLSPTAEEAALALQAARTLTDPFRGLPQESRAELEQALGYLLRDAPGLAVPVLDGLVARLPDLGAAHALLGLAAQRMDEAGRAVTELKRAAELSPEAPQPHLYLAELYAARGRPELAVQELGEALQRNPLEPQALRRLGILHAERPGGAEAALAPLRAAASLQPEDDGLALLLARAELSVPAEAALGLGRLERLAQRRPDDPEILLRLALALADRRAAAPEPGRTEMTRRAQELTEKVLSLQPDNAAAGRLLASLKG